MLCTAKPAARSTNDDDQERSAVNKAIFSPAVPIRTYERVVEQIEQAILSGQISAGENLPSERELMVQFSVSRPTIREALRVLQSSGMIRSMSGNRGGPRVLPVDANMLGHSFTKLARIASLSLGELVQFRLILESSACRLAAALRTAEQLTIMRQAVAQMSAEETHGREDFNQADLQFHASIWAASHNGLLTVCGQAVAASILNLMNDRLNNADDVGSTMRQAVAKDQAIFTAIEAQDSALAARLSHEAISTHFAGYLSAEERRGISALVS